MNEFENKVLNTIKKHNMIEFGDGIVVGLSGGADSCSLLLSLSKLAKEFNIKLIAAHLNHGIRGNEADADMDFSQNFAESLDIECITKKVSVPEYATKHKLSEEAAGREVRYLFFNELCKEYNLSKIAVAHNLNDRAETIILNMLRGSGSNGIEGIKPVNTNIIRPLIDCTREEIERYCSLNSVLYVTDTTNTQNIYARNLVRNSIFKDMTAINSNAIGNIIRFSDILLSESDYIDTKANEYVYTDDESGNIYIKKDDFAIAHIALKRKVLLKAILALKKSTQNISFNQIDLICNNFSTGKQYIIGDGIYIYTTHNKIIVTDKNPDISDYSYKITIPGNVIVKETGITYKVEYTCEYKKEKDTIYLSLDNTNEDNLIIRTRKDGDTFIPSGMTGRKKLKKFYIDSKINAHTKNLYPVIACENEILAVIPIRIGENYKVTDKTKKILKITKQGGTYENCK